MEKNKGNIVYLLIIILLIGILGIACYFGFTSNKDSSQNNNVNGENKVESIADTEFKPATYVIQFDEDLLGEEFKLAGNEIKDCEYAVSFLDNNKFNIDTGFGNSVQGTYSVDGNVINCILTTSDGENSTIQPIDGEISFRINNDSELEIIDVPEFYTIKIDMDGEKESKEMTLWPLVKGIKYVVEK